MLTEYLLHLPLPTQYRLRRVFILIDSHHGIKSHDADILNILRERAIPHQVILSKVDSILLDHKQKGGHHNKGKQKTLAKEVGRAEGEGRWPDYWADGSLEILKDSVNREIKPQIQPPIPVPGALGEILTCSAKMDQYQKGGLGISAIRVAILRAIGFG